MSTKNANGISKPVALPVPKNETPVKTVEKQTTQEATPEPPVVKPKFISVEERISTVGRLAELIQNRAIIKAHLERIKSLKFGDFDEKDSLVITSKGGNSYTINSSSLMVDIVKLCEDRMQAEILRIEDQINF